ncbi:hypothetical protein, partial [Lactiplantibacillus plantarum]|uniref:hypothetical protein n=1 Tax=Lactiplantibacillus plantarum TaxID=1590 RepID=UPI00271DFBBE|nr:adenine deaminase [Lactiplantibacillus plantarum]
IVFGVKPNNIVTYHLTLRFDETLIFDGFCKVFFLKLFLFERNNNRGMVGVGFFLGFALKLVDLVGWVEIFVIIFVGVGCWFA